MTDINDLRHKPVNQGVRNDDYKIESIDKFLEESEKFVQRNNEYNKYLRSGYVGRSVLGRNPNGVSVDLGPEGLGYSSYDPNSLIPGYTDLNAIRARNQAYLISTTAKVFAVLIFVVFFVVWKFYRSYKIKVQQ